MSLCTSLLYTGVCKYFKRGWLSCWIYNNASIRSKCWGSLLQVQRNLILMLYDNSFPSWYVSENFLNLFSFLFFFADRLMSRFMLNQTQYTLDEVLSKMSCPLLLVWGDLDPWVGSTKANRIKEFYPNTSLVNLQAGHCPHDEVPELVNKALLDWLSTLPTKSSLQTV